METKTPVRRYETRRNSRLKEPEVKTRVDWRRTKRNVIVINSDDDDEEELSSPEDEFSSPLEAEKNGAIVEKSSLADHEEKSPDDTVITEDAEDEPIAPGKRRRSSTSVMYDSDGSDDSDIPVRRVFAKRSCIMDEESSQEQQHPCSPLTAEDNLPSKDQKVLTEPKQVSKPNAIQASDDREYYEVIILPCGTHLILVNSVYMGFFHSRGELGIPQSQNSEYRICQSSRSNQAPVGFGLDFVFIAQD